MIGIIFSRLDQVVEVRIDGHNLTFRDNSNMNYFVPFENLRLNKDSTITEFPQLKDQEDWRQQAVVLFKQKLKDLGNEDAIMKYVIDDLSKFGFIALYYQKGGGRPIKLNE